MGFFRKTPEEKEAKRKKNFEKYERKLTDLLKNTKEKNPNISRVIFSVEIDMAVHKAKTLEEYKRCSPLLREWLEFVVRTYKIDQSELSIMECVKMGVSDTSITLTNWNTLERNVIDAIYGTAVAEDYKGVVELVDEFFTIRPKIINMRINRSYAGEKLVYNKEKIFVTLALYSGFAKYKLGDYDGALEVFNAFKGYTVPLKIEEGDYAGEVFGEYDNEIRSSTMIEKIESMK
ncbi:hypothetical protein [Methanobrevibacter sp.]|uniref:hypothetical protein n=1 Tax=Methanobrevibacter sp. TaxID=66852 RepID=UPI002E76683E|nr:hypothetical protein [Methanobrevibacter sp.]MEE0940134.1 hypothetical protein [Methanobrevibacter sp.]